MRNIFLNIVLPAIIVLGDALVFSSFATVAESAITINSPLTIAGDLDITGSLSKGSGTFVIDHPLDPKNKLLYHSFVESPEVLTMYAGETQLDEKGRVTVELPSYFLALNRNPSYLLTPRGEPMPNLHVTREVRPHWGLFGKPVFEIAGGTPRGTVSWMVQGERQDPYILANPIIPEVEKGPDAPYAQGSYVHPQLFEEP